MAFPYVRQTYVDGSGGGTPLSAARLNVTEAGVELASVKGIGAAPPGSPTDGMIWRPSPATGVYWAFQYDSALATYKWAGYGAQTPMYAEVTTDQSTTSATYVDLATVGPSVTVPRAGIYRIRFGVTAYNASAGVQAIRAAVKIGAAATADAEAISGDTASAATVQVAPMRVIERTLAASDVIKLQYKVSGAATAHFLNRWIEVAPIQVI